MNSINVPESHASFLRVYIEVFDVFPITILPEISNAIPDGVFAALGVAKPVSHAVPLCFRIFEPLEETSRNNKLLDQINSQAIT